MASSAELLFLIKDFRRSTPFVRAVGQRVRQARQAAGLSQTAAATQLGVKPPFFNRVEMGKAAPTPAVLEAACQWGACSLAWLLFGHEEDDGGAAEAQVAEAEAPYGKAAPPVQLPVTGRVLTRKADAPECRPVTSGQRMTLPSGATCERVVGNGLSPFATDGQFLVIIEEAAPSGGPVVVELEDGRRLYARMHRRKRQVILQRLGAASGTPPVVVAPKEVRRARWIRGVLW